MQQVNDDRDKEAKELKTRVRTCEENLSERDKQLKDITRKTSDMKVSAIQYSVETFDFSICVGDVTAESPKKKRTETLRSCISYCEYCLHKVNKISLRRSARKRTNCNPMLCFCKYVWLFKNSRNVFNSL